MAAIVCNNVLQMTAMLCSSAAEFSGSLGQNTRGCFLSLGGHLKDHTILFGEYLKDVYLYIVQMVLSPFFPYLAVTYILNIPPVVFGMESVFSVVCSSKWLMVNTFLTTMHILTGTYMVFRIRVEDQTLVAVEKQVSEVTGSSKVFLAPTTSADAAVEPTDYVRAEDGDAAAANVASGDGDDMKAERSPTIVTNRGSPSSWERIRYVMCYDMVMAIYYLLFVFWIIWQTIGTATILQNQQDEECGKYLILSVVCGFLYMGLVVVALICSICFLRYKKISEALVKQQQRRKTKPMDA